MPTLFLHPESTGPFTPASQTKPIFTIRIYFKGLTFKICLIVKLILNIKSFHNNKNIGFNSKTWCIISIPALYKHGRTHITLSFLGPSNVLFSFVILCSLSSAHCTRTYSMTQSNEWPNYITLPHCLPLTLFSTLTSVFNIQLHFTSVTWALRIKL